MNLSDLAASKLAVRFEDAQEIAGLDGNVLAHVALGKALVHQGVLLAFGHPLPHLLFDVPRVDILHTLVIGDIMSLCSFRFPRAAALLVREVLA
jgi:hypothetical protein